MNFQEHTVAEDIAPSEPLAPVKKSVYRYPVSFTGTGSEYFKIWIVNLLLIIVTCGIYYPWAKVRKSKYIYSNTMVDGVAFDYLGTGSVLAKGMLISALFFGIYQLLLSFGNPVILLAFFITALIAFPWLIWKSLRFKMSVTTYRALPFSFVATLKDTYKTYATILLIALLLLVPAVLGSVYFGGFNKYSLLNAKSMLFSFGLLMLAFILLLPPLMYYQLKKYQHNGYQWAGIRIRFHASALKFFKPWLLVFLTTVIAYVILGIVAAVSIPMYGMQSSKHLFDDQIVFWIVMGIAYLFMLVASLFSRAVFSSRLQNLIWNHTQAPGVQFNSNLRALPLLWVYLKNMFLTIITLGLYWPFAIVNLIKIKLSSFTVITALPLSGLATKEVTVKERNAIGESVANMFDIDISL
jgi:uncharacterized membrane protein YjgN (DUF898 family)